MNENSHETPLRWGEVLRTELNAKIEAVQREVIVLKATATTHKDFMLWGAGLGLALLAATLYLNQGLKDAQAETQKDVKALYDTIRTRKPQRRLENEVVSP